MDVIPFNFSKKHSRSALAGCIKRTEKRAVAKIFLISFKLSLRVLEKEFYYTAWMLYFYKTFSKVLSEV